MPNGYAHLDWNGLPRVASLLGTPADEQPIRAEPGEASGPQQNALADWAMSVGSPYPNGGNCNNPCGFPRYGELYAGSYATYDWMLRHPTITIARSQLLSPVKAAQLSYTPRDEGVPKEWVDFVKGQIENLRIDLMADVMTAPDYGWAGFEKVWKANAGQYELECLKPLAVRSTSIVADPSGRFAGLLPDNRTDVKESLGVHKSWLFTYGRRFGNLYGLPQLEHCRETAWTGWLDTTAELYRLLRKICGIMPVVYTPSGSRMTSDGRTVSWADSAATVLRGARNGDGIHLTHFGTTGPVAGVNNFEQLVALIKASAVRLEVVDFGSNAPAIEACLAVRTAHEQGMFAAYFQSPRTGMATEGGTKADSEQHTDTATVNSEEIGAMIGQAITRGIADDILTLNFGEAARGAVRVAPGKLTDDNLATDTALVTAVTTNAELSTNFLEQVDMDAVADRRGIPHKAPIVLEAIEADDGEDTIGGGADDETEDDDDEGD